MSLVVVADLSINLYIATHNFFGAVLPIGAFTGAITQLGNSLCTEPGADAIGTWFCSDSGFGRFARSLLTGVLPSLLMAIYQTVFLDRYVYGVAVIESRHFDLAGLDLYCGSIFFIWNIITFFLGGVGFYVNYERKCVVFAVLGSNFTINLILCMQLFGGTIFNGLRLAILDPSQIWTLLATAIPGASLFFVNYIIARAFVLSMLRLFMPYPAALIAVLRQAKILPSKPKTEREKAEVLPPRNFRFSRDIGIFFFSVFVCAGAFAIVVPIIAPFALIYFFLTYCVVRYQCLYVYHSAYGSKGLWWRWSAHRILFCIGLMVVFTSSVFYIKGAYIQGSIAVFGLLPCLGGYSLYLRTKYDSIVQSVPFAMLEAAPRLRLQRSLYVSPSLRPKKAGWYLEHGKCWQFYNATRWSI